MGTYVNEDIVQIPNEHRFGELPDILSELGGLLGVGTRASGQFAGKRVLADMCQAQSINILSVYKPTNSTDQVHTADSNKGDVSHAGYNRGYNAYGIVKPYITGSELSPLGSGGSPFQGGRIITGVQFGNLVGEWTHSGVNRNSVRDFHGYNHKASSQVSATFSCSNPDGKIAAQAELRYTWDDSMSFDRKYGSLGLKNIFGCDGVTHTEAYLGVVVYRTLTALPSGRALPALAVAMLHSVPLGSIDPLTQHVSPHYISFEIDDLIINEYDAGNVSDSSRRFFVGETGIKCLPFVAKWSSIDAKWYLMGLGVQPYSLSSPLALQGGEGSQTNTVAITRAVCTLTCVNEGDGYIRVGIAQDSDFSITTLGEGFLAFEKDNGFNIHPADVNAIPETITSVRLGKIIDSELDLPGLNVVNGGTYYASAVMYGRTANSGYTSPPTTRFRPYSYATSMKVGVEITYFKELKTWTTLSGEVEINLVNMANKYTITLQ